MRVEWKENKTNDYMYEYEDFQINAGMSQKDNPFWFFGNDVMTPLMYRFTISAVSQAKIDSCYATAP